MPEPIRLALVGAGIFSREAHVPALKALSDRFEIVAVYSRTRATAEALLPLLPGKPDVYTDLSTLLQRPDIEAVDVLLPIDALPAAIDMALAAGKHVVSEKPIAPDVASGRRLMNIYHHHPQQVWMVAENFRYTPAFQRAAEIVRSGEIGTIRLVDWTIYGSVTPTNKYYHTAWRRSGSFPGGFLLDGGVHHIAAIRMVAGEIVRVSAETRQMSPDLPPADTLASTLQFASGVIGSYTITYAAVVSSPTFLTIVGDKGMVRVNSQSLEITTDDERLNESVPSGKDIDDELTAFADAIRSGAPHMNSPLEALRDLAILEALLTSASTGTHVEVDPLSDLEPAE